MKRRLKIAALIFGSLVLVLLLFLAWVLNTEAGLRFAVARLPERLGKVTLKIENVHGTIVGGFGADRVDVDQERTHVRVDKGAARVNVLAAPGGAHRGSRSTRRCGDHRAQDAPAVRLRTRRRSSCRACSASARKPPPPAAWSSSRRTASAPSSPKSVARASSATRPSGYSKATSSTAFCTAARSASCAPPSR